MSRILASNPELSRESIAATSGTIEGMETRSKFSWRRVLLVTAMIVLPIVGCVVLATAHHDAQLAAIRSAYGGRKYTRAEARALRGDDDIFSIISPDQFLPPKVEP